MPSISKETAEHYTWGEGCDGWYLVKSAGLSVIHERMPAGTAEIRHYHQHARQFFFILSGTASFQLGEQSITLTAQQGIEVPPAIVHHIQNSSSEPIEFLVISQPPTQGDRVMAVEDVALEKSVQVNSRENARLTFNHVVTDHLQEMVETNFKFYKHVSDDAQFADLFLEWLFDRYLTTAKRAA